MGQQRSTKIEIPVETVGFLLFARGKKCRPLPVSGRFDENFELC